MLAIMWKFGARCFRFSDTLLVRSLVGVDLVFGCVIEPWVCMARVGVPIAG